MRTWMCVHYELHRVFNDTLYDYIFLHREIHDAKAYQKTKLLIIISLVVLKTWLLTLSYIYIFLFFFWCAHNVPFLALSSQCKMYNAYVQYS